MSRWSAFGGRQYDPRPLHEPRFDRLDHTRWFSSALSYSLNAGEGRRILVAPLIARFTRQPASNHIIVIYATAH